MDKVFWFNYLFFVDFSSEKDALSAIPTGQLSEANTTLLAAMLSNHDNGEGRSLWTDKPGTAWSLAEAEVEFNGENHTNLPTNARFDHVLILKFPDTSTAPVGNIVLNYNVGTAA
jgi:hypothetical protein